MKVNVGCWSCVLLLSIVAEASLTNDEELTSLMDEYYEWKVGQFPEFATVTGSDLHQDKLTNLTLDSYAQVKNGCSNFLDRLKMIQKRGLEGEDLDNYEILEDELTTIVRGYAWVQYGLLTPINYLHGPLQSPSWPYYASITTEKNQTNYIKRLRAFVLQINQGIDLMKLAIRLNRTAHHVTVRGIPNDIQQILDAGNGSVFFLPYKRSSFQLSLSEAKRTSFYEEATSVVFDEIFPALRMFVKFIREDYMNHTRRELGVGAWDSGTDFYKACLDYHISLNMTSQEVHDLGLQEVARIEGEMRKVQRRLNFNGTFPEFFRYLRENRTTDFYGLSEEEILQRYRNILVKRINPKMRLVTRKDPEAPLLVVKQGVDGPPASYGHSGVFRVNTIHPKTRDTFTMMSIALHEGNPGHHLQISLQKTLDLPKFRLLQHSLGIHSKPFDFPWYTAYVEGWALYAEFLGEELDLYNTSALELFGRYTTEMMRACRLVVDTGIHVYGWSKAKAMKYLVDRVAMAEHQLENEVDRYVSYPGQACSYKIGEIEIMRLRKEAREKLGDKFDVVSFNDVVLMSGKAPLTVVERAVHAYIRDNLIPSPVLSTGYRCTISVRLAYLLVGMAALLMSVGWK